MICFSLAFPMCAQKQGQERIDSFLKALPNAKEDTNKVYLLNYLSFSYNEIDPDQGIKYGNQDLALAQKLQWKKGIALANGCIGTNYYAKSDFDKALEYDLTALSIFEELGDKNEIARSFGNIGVVYQHLSKYPEALDYDLKALKINEELDNKSGIAQDLGNISVVYWRQKDYQKALVYNLKALKIDESLGDKNSIAEDLGNIGAIYEDQNDYQNALEYDIKALKIVEELGEKSGAAINLSNIGNIYEHQHNYPKALEYDFRALKLAEELGNKNQIAASLGNVGEVYLYIAKDASGNIRPDSLIPSGQTARLNKAIEYYQKGIVISREINFGEAIIDFSQGLSDAEAMLGNYKAAYENYKQYATLNDSVHSSQNAEEMANREARDKLELKDKQIQINKLEVERKRIESVFFIVGIILLVLVIVFILRNFWLQKKSNALLAKEKLRSDNLLLNILPVEVAEELKDKGSADAKYFDNVSVLFTDFVGFTKTSERLTPHELIFELDACFKVFDGIMGKYKIEKIKTIGDAYLAVSGLPVADPLHAEHIILAALEIQGFMLKRRESLGDKTFEIRIGIHSGAVIAGIVGVKKFAYDIWGDTVNTAARMEQNCVGGKINVSESTYQLVKDKFIFIPRGKIEAKNKGQIEMYFIEGVAEDKPVTI